MANKNDTSHPGESVPSGDAAKQQPLANTARMPAARRRPPRLEEDEHENHERWLVSYADFITLLFAFFVVMYALSTINLGKYKIMTESIVEAFHRIPNAPPKNGPAGDGGPAAAESVLNVSASQTFTQSLKRNLAMRILRKQADELKQRLQPLVLAGKVRISETPTAIVVDINSDLLFLPGSAEPSPVAQSILVEVALVVQQGGEAILVEGHTDAMPIANQQFASNWELSAARAAGVTRLMAGWEIAPSRLRAVGFGEYRPVADNAAPEGRAQNRRVRLKLLAEIPGD